MYYGQAASWNLRDRHMFDTLEALLAFHGPDARAVVWAHNSHVGNAAATEMSTRGEFNVGQLCRERFGRDAFLLGFGTDRGTVAAAHDWGAPMQVMAVRPSHAESYELLRPTRSGPLPRPRARACPTRTRLACDRVVAARGDRCRQGPAGAHARGAHLAQRTALSLDRRVRRRAAGVPVARGPRR